ncbi:DUF881 domain-containing protein [Nocardioides humi]|uniref:DUF881 domain-containing protein n=1 Tax=Nocardioides humi TaxID=449461 RepID=A0ABN2B673_9ACTN|nr:DUF881 domain-containing protein [Nocardioides humi]
MPEPEAEVPVTPADRLRQALLRPSRRQVVAGLLLAVLGFGAVIQVRTAGTDETYAGLREQELIDLLNGLAGTRQRTEAEIDRLEEVAGGLRDDVTRRQTAIDQADKEIADLNILAGIVPVTGPGIRVRIEEEDGRVRLGSLLDTIQELRTVGAEAIEINGAVRVVAQTSFSEVDGGFLVDGERVEAPYVIVAIGDPGALAQAVTFASGPKMQLEEDGAEVEVEEKSTVDIEAVVRRDRPSYAVPDQGQ